MRRFRKSTAPGKIILSGEHAVVYGGSAIAVAVNRYVTTTVSPEKNYDIVFYDVDSNLSCSFYWDQLKALRERIRIDYCSFVKGERSIREVLKTPLELAQLTLSLFLEASQFDPLPGIRLSMQSTLPVGAGMGSSAALILSILMAMMKYSRIPFSSEKIFQLAREAENHQHGFSSGLDLRAVLQGGAVFISPASKKNGDANFWDVEKSLNFVYTGMPQSTTGECVQRVAPYFKDQYRIDDFSLVTNTLKQALQKNNIVSLLDCIKENNQLLDQIGVVPQMVQAFIAEVEKIGGAAKICGAGAVRGSAAGMVWVMCEDEVAFKKIAEKYHYDLLSLNIELRGAYVD